MSAETKKEPIKVLIDATPREQRLQEELSKANKTIGALLIQHKNEFMEEIEPKKPELADGDSTANLVNEPTYQQSHPQRPTYEIDPDDPIPLDIKGENPKQIIGFLKKNAEMGNHDAEKILGKLVKKALRQSGTFEYRGNLCKWERHGDKVVKASRNPEFVKIEDD